MNIDRADIPGKFLLLLKQFQTSKKLTEGWGRGIEIKNHLNHIITYFL